MKDSQERRYQRIFKEPLYLLEKETQNSNLVFTISGSTANIYQVTILPNKKIKCSCPDMESWAKHDHCICKHCCFVLFKVLKTFDPYQTNFFQTLIFNAEEYERLQTKFHHLMIQDQLSEDYIDSGALEKYQNLKSHGLLLTDLDSNPFQQKKTVDSEDMCAVCFDEFEGTQNVECPVCHNLIHQACIQKWLQMGKKNCVYCRSDVWKNFGKKKSSEEYQNLYQ